MNSTRKARLLQLVVAPLVAALSFQLNAVASPPAEAIQHGYTVNTFSSNFTAQTVDMNRTLNRGYKWYLADLFGHTASATEVKINGDGSATLLGDASGNNLMSMVLYPGTNDYVGTAFGGGAYIEAVFNWSQAQVAAKHAGGVRYAYPAFWSLPFEGNISTSGNQWPGQPAGYIHNVEADFFEADYSTEPRAYGSGLHDWYGILGKTCPPGLCGVGQKNPSGGRVAPVGTDFTQYHTFGFLWVPATATTKGFNEIYLDGKVIGGILTWSQYTNQPPTPVGQPWVFGRIDQQHLFFILGTGLGETFNVKSVNVWQKSAANNIVN